MTAKTNSQKNNDTILKVIALICALMLWFYAEAQENPSKERQLTVPIQYVNAAADLVVENAPQSIQVTIKGNETNIMSLRSDDFTAVVDLSNAMIGSGTYPVQVTTSAVTERFTYTPDKVSVSVDQITQKEVPVQLRTEGSLAQQYEVQHIDLQPNTVVIKGKLSVIGDLQFVETVPIDISGIDADKSLIGFLQLPEGVSAQTDGTGFHTDVEITVQLYVQPIQETKELQAMITVRNLSEGFAAMLEPAVASLTLRGDADVLEMQPILDQVVLYVDCAGLSIGTHTVPIQITASDETVLQVLSEVTPQSITVTVTNEAMMIDEMIEPNNGAVE